MSEPTSNPRPRQVTLVGWLTMVGSVIVVALVFDRVAGLHTIETRESVEKFLAEPPGSDLGLGVDGVLSIMRTLALVAGGCAAAAAILGYQVLRRSRSARLALTVLAVPLFVAGMVTGGFVSSLIAASSVMLWLQPARDWFDGITTRAPAAAPVPAAPTPAAPDPGQATTPAPTAPVAAGERPAAVTWACILTWVGTGLALLGTLATGVLLAVQPDALLDEVHRQNPQLDAQGVSDGLLLGVTFAMLVGFAGWAVGAAVIALLVLRRHEWARIVLIVSASTAAALFLLGTVLGAFLFAITLVTSVVTVVMLVRPEARAWFATGRGPRPPVGADPPR